MICGERAVPTRVVRPRFFAASLKESECFVAKLLSFSGNRSDSYVDERQSVQNTSVPSRRNKVVSMLLESQCVTVKTFEGSFVVEVLEVGQ